MTARSTTSQVALLAVLFGGCHQDQQPKPSSAAVAPRKLDEPGIDNLYQLGEQLYSGSQPHGDDGFQTLSDLGIKTIISVDGAVPEVALAKKHGIRYVHLPIGYDGIGDDQALKIVKAATALPGPVFIHCHHGKHRGPSAAAVACIARYGWSPDEAAAWLDEAGTSPNYAGLFRDVRNFKAPSATKLDEVPTDFPEAATVTGFVDAMVEIDHRWEKIGRLHEAGFRRTEADHDPVQESLLLVESFRELKQLDAAKSRGDDFTAQLNDAADAAQALFDAIQSDDNQEQVEVAFVSVGECCKKCHARFRDISTTP